MSLHPREAQLIKLIRDRFKWGEITIETKEGLPFRMMKAHDWTMLTGDVLSTPD